MQLGLATLCSRLLPIVRQSIYDSVDITDQNILHLLRTSRQLEFTNLAGTRSVDITLPYSNKLNNVAAYIEVASKLRPFSLYTFCSSPDYHSDMKAILAAFDVCRLSQATVPSQWAGELIRRAFPTLRSLSILAHPLSGSVVGGFDFSEGSPNSIPLTLLSLETFGQSEFELPHNFRRFLRACDHLETLGLYVENGRVADKIVKLCGRNLLDLEIDSPRLDDWISTVTLATSCPRLRALRLSVDMILRLQPYPPTLRKLAFIGVSVEKTARILSALRSPGSLPKLSFLRVAFSEDDWEADSEEAIFNMKELAAECERQGISFDGEIEHY